MLQFINSGQYGWSEGVSPTKLSKSMN